MKVILIAMVLFTMNAWAQTPEQRKELLRERMQSETGYVPLREKGLCTYELVGASKGVIKFFEDELDYSQCKEAAAEALKANTDGHNKALIKHPSRTKWVVIERD